jgi:hypothetical protein
MNEWVRARATEAMKHLGKMREPGTKREARCSEQNISLTLRAS